jgi:hypothetical protein
LRRSSPQRWRREHSAAPAVFEHGGGPFYRVPAMNLPVELEAVLREVNGTPRERMFDAIRAACLKLCDGDQQKADDLHELLDDHLDAEISMEANEP